MSELEQIIREKIADIDGMLIETRQDYLGVVWDLPTAAYYERWELVRDSLDEVLEAAGLPTVPKP